MSMTLTVELENSGFQCDPREDLPAHPRNYFNAGALPYICKELDELIERQDIRPISEFIYDGDMLSDEEYADLGQTRPEKEWFPPSDGVNTVERIIALLKVQNSQEQLECCSVDDAVYELEVVRSILRKAESGNERFSFNVG